MYISLQALGIESLRDASTLINYFVPYSWCTVCSFSDEASYKSSFKTLSVSNKPEATSCDENLDVDLASYINIFDKSYHQIETAENRHSVLAACPSVPSAPRRPITPCQRHTFAIEPGCVLTVLREYVQFCLTSNARVVIGGIGASSASTPMTARLTCVRNTVSRLLTNEDVDVFWGRYKEIFTEERHKLWESLEMGLKEYLRVLQRRDQLDTECEYLRQQNRELYHMLQPYEKYINK